MLLLPAIDLREGKVVRLLRGERNRETVYGDSPADAACRWRDEGAEWLHVVDLDGAFDGVSRNEPCLEAIVRAAGIPVEVGGGIRTREKAERLLGFGVARVILGTKALEDRAFLRELCAAHPGKVCVGVDARDGRVVTRGWVEESPVRADDFLRELAGCGAAAAIVTDIARDGALAGPNLEAMRSACAASPLPVIASGGVTTVEDIRALAKLPLLGAIIGKALYEGSLRFADALAAARAD